MPFESTTSKSILQINRHKMPFVCVCNVKWFEFHKIGHKAPPKHENIVPNGNT